MDAGAIALTIDEAAAMVHFNQGVDTGKDVFVSRDLLFFDAGHDTAGIMFFLVKFFECSRCPLLGHICGLNKVTLILCLSPPVACV